MPGEVRRNLEKIFRCTVRSWYSNEENGIMGLQREEDESYYIDTESYYYEILKLDSDEPAEPGELGRIVITDLYNYAIPLIRYDNGDLAVAERKEKDGRFRLYLKELYGRRGDMIYLSLIHILNYLRNNPYLQIHLHSYTFTWKKSIEK